MGVLGDGKKEEDSYVLLGGGEKGKDAGSREDWLSCLFVEMDKVGKLTGGVCVRGL